MNTKIYNSGMLESDLLKLRDPKAYLYNQIEFEDWEGKAYTNRLYYSIQDLISFCVNDVQDRRLETGTLLNLLEVPRCETLKQRLALYYLTGREEQSSHESD